MTRDQSAAQTRSRIVTVARALFIIHGYERVTIRQIATAAGVSTGALFSSNWVSKEELFTEVTGRAPLNDAQAIAMLCALRAIKDGTGAYGLSGCEYKRIAAAAIEEVLPAARSLR